MLGGPEPPAGDWGASLGGRPGVSTRSPRSQGTGTGAGTTPPEDRRANQTAPANTTPKLNSPYRHGSTAPTATAQQPLPHCTPEIANRSVGEYLTTDQAHDAQHWIENDRRIRELLTRLQTPGIEHLEADRSHT